MKFITIHERVFLYTVPGPVSSLLVTPGVVQVNFTWSPPSEPNGVIVHYEIVFLISGVENSINVSMSTQHTVRNLPPNTPVTFSVRAHTIGPGQPVTTNTSTMNIRESRTQAACMHAC